MPVVFGALPGRVREGVAGWGSTGTAGAHTKRKCGPVLEKSGVGLRWCLARGAVIRVSLNFAIEIELKSLILAQIERWRHALHMQVERGEGATLHSVANG